MKDLDIMERCNLAGYLIRYRNELVKDGEEAAEMDLFQDPDDVLALVATEKMLDVVFADIKFRSNQ